MTDYPDLSRYDIVPGQGRARRLVPAERAEKAEAAIARVREVCGKPLPTWRPHGDGLVRVEDVLRALDGGAE